MFWGQSFECLRQAQCTLSSCLSIHFFPKYTDIDRFSIYFPKFFARLTLKICPTYRLFNAALRAPPPPPRLLRLWGQPTICAFYTCNIATVNSVSQKRLPFQIQFNLIQTTYCSTLKIHCCFWATNT